MSEEDPLLQKRSKLRQELNKAEHIIEKNKISDEIVENDSKISKIIAEKNKNIIKEHFQGMSNVDGGFCQTKMWNLKAKIMPKNSSNPPTAKKDKELLRKISLIFKAEKKKIRSNCTKLPE